MSALGGLDDAQVVRETRAVFEDAEGIWIVGGAIRDALAGRPVLDLDLALSGDPGVSARRLAGETHGTAFPLSEEFGGWRVIGPAGVWRVDFAALQAPTIEGDLVLRDYTVNAMAAPLSGGDSIDPTGGAADLSAGILRATGREAFESDPLRLLRGPRIAAELGLEPERATIDAARSVADRAGEPAGERQFAELRQAIAGRDPLRALELMDIFGVTPVVLPELEAMRGVEQNAYHHLDVHGHTREVLAEWLEIERDPGALLGFGDEIDAWLELPLADEMTRGEAIRFAALLHDVGKPATRAVNEEGRVLFWGHDRVGEEIVRELCARLRTSRRLSHELELLTRHHLRLGFLVDEQPLDRSAIYCYLAATDPVALDVTLLSVADRLATRGERSRQEAIDAHVSLAREMVGECLAWIEAPPEPPVRGDELAEAMGIEPGPRLGELLAELREAVFTGRISDKEGAIEMARKSIEGSNG